MFVCLVDCLCGWVWVWVWWWQKTDGVLHAELTAEIQKELNSELNRLRSGQRNKDNENAKAYEQVSTVVP